MRIHSCVLALLWLAGVLGAQAPVPPVYQWDLPPRVAAPIVPAAVPLTPARIELGRHLFYDTRLSGNGTQACATCHRQEHAFTDGRGRALGSTGMVHPRGAMSLVNVAYRDALTWANPAMRQLEEQALVPLLGEAPIELGLKGLAFLESLTDRDVLRDPRWSDPWK